MKHSSTLSNADHAFGKFLKNAGWDGDTNVKGNAVEYTLNGEILALGVYDNKKCKYDVYLP